MNIHTTLMVVVKCDTPHSCLMVNPHLSGAADVNTVYCELHNNRPKTAETSAIRVS